VIAPEVVVIGGVAAVAGGALLVIKRRERQRREAYEEYCLIRGYRFEADRPGGHERYAGLLDLFHSGHRRRWGYTITGTKGGFPFTAFEYQWVTGGGKSSNTHRVHAILWERDGTALPKFALTPETLLDRIGGAFGMQDIDFEESPEFSRAYRLRGEDEGAIRRLFTTELRAFFAATPGQRLSAQGPALFWWRSGRLPTADRLDEWLEEGDRVRRRFFVE
jgi:hypothetical protein